MARFIHHLLFFQKRESRFLILLCAIILFYFLNIPNIHADDSKIVFDRNYYNDIKNQKEKETYQDKKIKPPKLDLTYVKEQKTTG